MNKGNDNGHSIFVKSIPSAFCTIMVFFMSLTYLIYEGYNGLYLYKYDRFQSQTITNSMMNDKTYSEFDIHDFEFMPTLEMQTWGESDGFFNVNDLIEDTEQTTGQDGGWYSSIPIDMDKLLQYIEHVINYRETIDGETRYIS